MNAPRERLSALDHPAKNRGYSAGYTRFIRWMRLILPLIAVSIIVALFIWTTEREEQIVKNDQNQKDVTEVEPRTAQNELLNPHFQSTDEKGQPFSIRAEKALQAPSDENLILMQSPAGTIALLEGNSYKISSESGAYHQINEKISLEGRVKLQDDLGYTATMPNVDIDLKEELAWSDSPVEIFGPKGTLQAQNFKANHKTGILTFGGPAKLTLTEGAL